MSQKHMASRIKKENSVTLNPLKKKISFEMDIMLEKMSIQLIPKCKKELKK